MTCMTLVLLGQLLPDRALRRAAGLHALQRGRRIWPGPSSAACASTTAGPSIPISDKFMLAGGHCIPTCYALWMIMGQALERRYQATGNRRYYVDPARRDAADRRARLPPRRRRADDAAPGSRPRRSSALRPGQGARHQGAGRPRREHRRHQRRQRRPLGHRHRHRRRQGRVLGRRRRGDRRARRSSPSKASSR